MVVNTSKPNKWPAAACSLIFFITGLPFLSYPGLQQDELLFAAPLYRIEDGLEHWRIFHHNIPIMTMTYVGALKSWLCAPVLWFCGPSAYSVRAPALLIGSLTVWILFRWLDQVQGRGTAWIGALLLATDSSYLLTTAFDWGPVALQHLLTLAGLVLLLHFHHHSARPALALAFFCFGLALWDKALFVWTAVAFACAAGLLFPRETLRHLTFKNLAAATLPFLLGAFPLVAYNVRKQFPTFHATSGFSTSELYQKSFELRATWEGQALFGYLANNDSAPNAREPRNALERLSFRVHTLAGNWNHNALEWAAIAGALLFIPALLLPDRRRFVLFCAVVTALIWVQMAITRGTGGAAHHVVLLWPFPHALLAAVFAGAAQRLGRPGPWLAALGVALLATTNLLVTNRYLYQFARNGSPGSWSDASYALAAGLKQSNPSWVALLDWGIDHPLDVLDEGRLPLVWASAPFERPDSTEQPLPALVNDPKVLWIEHTEAYEEFNGIDARVDAFAHRAGLTKIPVATYYDSNRRAVFQVFHLARPEQIK